MKQYIQGAACTTLLILIVLTMVLAARTRLSARETGFAISLFFISGSVFIGYIYKRWNGPLFFAEDGKSLIRLTPFLLGVGTVLGPTKLLLSPISIPTSIPLVKIFLFVISIPLAGATILGAMLVGSLFHRRAPTWL